MKKATPKDSDVKSDNTKEYRKLELTDFNDNQLDKIFSLLKQLKRPGIGRYKIKENEIQGLTSTDITWCLNVINPIYSDRIDSIDITEYEKYAEGVEVVKTKDKITIKTPADLRKNPVFFFSGLEDGGGKYLERTFMVGQLLDLALSEVAEIIEKQSRYINLIDNKFFYRNSLIDINENTEVHDLVKYIYIHFNGKDGEIEIKELIDGLKKITRFKNKKKGEIRTKLSQSLSSNSMGFGKKILAKNTDSHKIFELKKDKLIFRNKY